MKYLLPFYMDAALGSEWSKLKTLGGVQIWKNPKARGCRVALERTAKASTKPESFYKTKVFTNNLQKQKALTLRYFGIRNWKFEIKKIQTTESGVSVAFAGDYEDNRSRKIYYRELHLYGKKELTQLLLTCDRSETVVAQGSS